jgi:hypothetical protein
MREVALLVAHLGLGEVSRFAPVLQLRGTWMSLKEQLCPATCVHHLRRSYQKRKEREQRRFRERKSDSTVTAWTLGKGLFCNYKAYTCNTKLDFVSPYPKGNHGGTYIDP